MRLFILITALFVSSVYANSINLVKITNEEDQTTSLINVTVNEDKNIIGFAKTVMEGGINIQSISFPGVLDYSGIVLYRAKNRAVIKVKGLNFEGKNGGAIEIDYLYNGIFNKRKQFVVTIERTSDSWQMTKDGRIINHLHLVSHKVPFAGVVGVKRIEIK